MKRLYFSSLLLFCVWPAAGADDDFVAAVRQRALSHVGTLPNFVCIRERYESAQMGASLDNYIVDDSRTEVSYYDNKEHYKPLKEGPVAPEIGVISNGEFGGTLHLIFDPGSPTVFQVKQAQTIRGVKTMRIDFQAPVEGSKMALSIGDRRVAAAYEGTCWADVESKQIVRLQLKVPRMPADFHIQSASQLIDYGRVKIGEGTYWLPLNAASEASLVAQAGEFELDLAKTIFGYSPPGISWGKATVKNLVKFKGYRKFEAESKLVP